MNASDEPRTPRGVLRHDASGAIVEWNEEALAILGLSASELTGRTSRDPRWRTLREDGSRFPPEQHPAMVTLRTGRPQKGVRMGVHKPDGRLTWIEIETEASPPDHVPPAGVIVCFRIVGAP